MTPATMSEAIIYLRLSDFRDDDDTTFDARETELRTLAADLGLSVVRVAVENDLNGNGKARGASAYKTPVKVTTSTGQVEFRTDRPVFRGVVLDLQRGAAGVLIVADDSRISRNHRDGLDLLDACRVSGASAVAPDDEGNPRWILTRGGTHSEVSAFQDRINDARKYSDDVAAKVRKGRARWAGKSYQGGRRPYGFRVDTTTEQHARNLIIDQAEAEVIRTAAADILGKSFSLKAVARDLREAGVPTVTGTAWSAKILRDVLIKPAVAGLAVKRGELVGAPWEPIIDRDRWERLKGMLTDPARRTNTGRANEPRWLLSGFAECGVCHRPLRVGGGRDRTPGYIGAECCHVRRAAAAVDTYLGDLVVARLERDDVADLLKPLPRPEVDTKRQRAEERRLDRVRREKRQMHTDGLITGTELAADLRDIARRVEAVQVQLASTDQPDPLAEFRGQLARVVWEALPMARKRAVVQLLIASVVVERAGRRGRGFDYRTVTVTWRPQVGAP